MVSYQYSDTVRLFYSVKHGVLGLDANCWTVVSDVVYDLLNAPQDFKVTTVTVLLHAVLLYNPPASQCVSQRQTSSASDANSLLGLRSNFSPQRD